MRLTKTLLFVAVVLAGCVSLQAQDLHNSLFYMNPLHMNPAFSGAFEGTYRIGGLYRDHGRAAIGSAAYSTPTIFVDVPIIMIGPGTGIAPFRAFLQELEEEKCKGYNERQTMLFFGCQHPEMDFLYKNELQEFYRRSVLKYLHVAFSRYQDTDTFNVSSIL